GGWGGRFERAGRGLFRDARDTIGTVSDVRATVWRWRPAFQADFQTRLDWCVKPFPGANHPPRPVVNGDRTSNVLVLKQPPESVAKLDAAGSQDPDGDA